MMVFKKKRKDRSECKWASVFFYGLYIKVFENLNFYFSIVQPTFFGFESHDMAFD